MLTDLIPTQWSLAFTFIKYLKRSYLDARLVAIIISKLHQRQMFIPNTSKVLYTCSNNILKDIYHPFQLSINLRMKGHTELRFGVHSPM